MDPEDALSSLGRCGRFQLINYLIISIVCTWVGCWHMLSIVFVGAEPSYHCKLPENATLNESAPIVKNMLGKLAPSQCHVYVNYSLATNKTVSCPEADGYHYNKGNGLYSIVQEWNLICGRGYLVELSQTILVLGVMIGAIVMSWVSDKIGRKKVFLLSVFCIGLSGFITAFMPNIYAFLVLRFFTGFFQQGVVLSGFILACELFRADVRTYAGTMLQTFWAVGMGVMALAAWGLPNWRHQQMLISAFCIVAIPLYWFFSESVPWLIAKSRTKEWKQVLARGARWNGVELAERFQYGRGEDDEELLTKEQQIEAQKEAASRRKSSIVVALKSLKSTASGGINYSLLDVLKSSRLRLFSLILAFLWFINSLVYYGLSLSAGSLAGSIYLNFALSGLVEIPAYIVAAFSLQYIGRRYPICAFHLIAGVALFATVFIPLETEDGRDLRPWRVACAMIGKFGITGSFGSVFLYAPELFPTTVRNLGMGISSVGGRIGGLLAPFTSLVIRELPWFPGVVFGTLSVLGGLLVLLLPETLNRALPSTIEDVENWTRTMTKEERAKLKADRQARKARDKN